MKTTIRQINAAVVIETGADTVGFDPHDVFGVYTCANGLGLMLRRGQNPLTMPLPAEDNPKEVVLAVITFITHMQLPPTSTGPLPRVRSTPRKPRKPRKQRKISK